MPDASAPKILVQDKSNNYYLISKDAVPVPVNSNTDFVNTISDINTRLNTYFASVNPPGVKVGIAILDI